MLQEKLLHKGKENVEGAESKGEEEAEAQNIKEGGEQKI